MTSVGEISWGDFYMIAHSKLEYATTPDTLFGVCPSIINVQ